MSDGRCRACGAAVAPNAGWCSLCFADLRTPAPEPVHEPAAVAAAQPVAAHATAPLTAPAPVASTAPIEIDPADPLGLEPKPVLTPTWPCPRCGHDVPIELDACNECGAGFLAGSAAAKPVKLPGVGDVTTMSSSQRLLMAVGIAIAVTAVLVLLAFIGGHLFA